MPPWVRACRAAFFFLTRIPVGGFPFSEAEWRWAAGWFPFVGLVLGAGMAGVWLAQNYGTFTTVAERLKPESLYDRFIAYRESLGFEVLPATGGERPPMEVLAERLRANRFVCLMADRDLTRAGVRVDFFGEPTRLPAGPAKLAIETGAPLHPAHVYYDGEDCVVRIDDALDTSSGDVGVVTQALADRFAVNIAAHPQDWHMLQPLWLADLSESRRAYLEAT